MAKVNRILDSMDDARQRRSTTRITAKDRSFMVAAPATIFARDMFGDELEGHVRQNKRDRDLTEDNGATISNLKGQTLVGAMTGFPASGRGSAIHYSRNAELSLDVNPRPSRRRSSNRKNK
jgi:hypothetical protein